MFRLDKYQVIKKAVSFELANFIFNYFLLKKDAVNWMYKNNIVYDIGILGTWSDNQVPNTYSCYADPVMETLMMKVLPVMKKETGLDLIPTYSYSRLYKKGDILHRHKDRPSCEISTTLYLGGTPWPIYLDPTGKEDQEGTRVDLGIGDMLIYKGEKLEHWRYPLHGQDCAQVFLHYNNIERENATQNRFDGRECLGVPKCLQRKK